jgi:hypothetical protein
MTQYNSRMTISVAVGSRTLWLISVISLQTSADSEPSEGGYHPKTSRAMVPMSLYNLEYISAQDTASGAFIYCD